MTSRAPRHPADTLIAVCDADEQAARRLADLFAETFATDRAAVSLVETGAGWRVTLYFDGAVDAAAVRKLVAAAGIGRLRLARLAPKDWVADSLAGLQPVAAGRFVVHGAHDRARIAGNRIGIEIEAALAFGTGHHPSTRGCLLALDRICKMSRKRIRVLDLGTGSGVLAIAAARALHAPVLAIDVDPAAVRAARANARRNRAPVKVCRADGVTAPAIRAAAPFALVFANILLEPLQRLAAPLRRLTAPGGRIVLSGLLAAQANAARAAYRGLALERRIDLDGWTTLVLRQAERRGAQSAFPSPLWGGVRGGGRMVQPTDPPPHPSPTRGEGAVSLADSN